MIVTVEDLLGQAKKREDKKTFKVYVTELDREIECNAISRKEYLDIVFSGTKDEDSEIIYNSCPIFRNDDLIKKLKCELNPVDVVDKVLSASSIYALTKLILQQSEIENGAVSKYVKLMENDIKN